ncbi:MAG: hypothetical protein R3336_03365, partial [Phycisphaeraceae bacterium]|nr:hypothetical protein [Phycisphaeraceae bacterium]
MRDGFPQHRWILAATVALLVLTSLAPTAWTRWATAKPRAMLNLVLAPVTHPLKQVSDMMRRPADEPTDLGAEGEQLRRHYEQALQYLRRLEEANRRLRQ